MKTYLYHITSGFAQRNKLPMYFVAVPLIETEKAFYVYGRGTVETAKMGVCCVCGRTLTHPVSVELGIGPECGRHYWDWDLVGGYTKENIARLTKVVQENIHVDSWIPKSRIIKTLPTNEVVVVPPDHPKLQSINNKSDRPTRRAFLSANDIRIEFPYNINDLDKIRSLPSRKFHSDGKYWTAPLNIEVVENLKAWGFQLSTELETYLSKTKLNVGQITETDTSKLNLSPELYAFQKQGVAFIEAKQGRALIADEMGLGKTIQTLTWLELHPDKQPVVIVVPASLKLNWVKEATRWMTSPKCQILSGETSNTPLTGEIIIINYDILIHWVEALQRIKPQVLILDEVHYTKNSSAKRTKAVKALSKGIPHVIALSGTPIINRPVEIFNAVKLIDPTVIPSFFEYAHRYCGARHNGYGWDFSGATNTQELHDKLTNTIMIRRRKEDVLNDLPGKTRSFIPIELDNEKEYHAAEMDFVEFVRQQKGQAAANRASNAQSLVEIEGLKQLAVKGKLTQVTDWIRNFLEVDGKLVVFVTHHFVIDHLMTTFKSIAVKVDGTVSGQARQDAVDRFQNNPNIQLFVGNIKAAGVGITLTAASNVAFIELPWTPGDLTQAEDRCHRIGQKDSVNIHYLLAENTIEENIARLLDRKRKVLDSVLDGKETDQESLLSELMKEYENNNV